MKPPRDANTLNKNEAYLLEWARRACEYPNPPIYENVAVFLSTLGEISREAVQLGMQKDAGFKLGMPRVPETVINKIAKDGLLMVRKLVSDPNSDFEKDVVPQVILTQSVAQLFGVTLRRVAQTDIYATVDSIRDSLVKSFGVASLKGCEGTLEGITTNYEKLTGLLGDPLPLKRLPQYKAR